MHFKYKSSSGHSKKSENRLLNRNVVLCGGSNMSIRYNYMADFHEKFCAD